MASLNSKAKAYRRAAFFLEALPQKDEEIGEVMQEIIDTLRKQANGYDEAARTFAQEERICGHGTTRSIPSLAPVAFSQKS